MFELFMIIGGALMRVLPHIPNFTPIAAIALFGSVYLNKRYALVLPLAAMVVSDFFLGFSQSTPYVYAAFLLTGAIGLWLRTHKTFTNVLLGTLLSSVFFFLITNFGFWLTFSLYPKTFAGQMEAYMMALPFFRNSLLGDLFYTGLMFGSYELVKAYFAKKAFATSKAK